MTKVWLVWVGEYSDGHVVATCSTEALANAVVAFLANGAYVEEMLVDAWADPLARGLMPWSIGASVDCPYYPDTTTACPSENPNDAPAMKIWRNPGTGTWGEKTGRAPWASVGGVVLARDRAHAERIAQEYQRKLGHWWEVLGGKNGAPVPDDLGGVVE